MILRKIFHFDMNQSEYNAHNNEMVIKNYA